MLDNKVIMVTGGTGSFGNAVTKSILKKYECKEIIIFSRDEKKQYEMRLEFNDPRLKFRTMKGVNLVFHAAALKHVPSCEFFPLEAIKTNVLGSSNVLDAAEFHEIERVVILSTDKAVYAINAMGMSKALMEKVMIARSRNAKSRTVFCGVRYGNVMYSRGSVIPLFVSQIKAGKPLTITNPQMTRFLMPLPDSVKLVLFALEKGGNGDIFVKKSPASTVGDLARSCLNVFHSNNDIVDIGIREGEKMHETLVTQEELINSEDLGDYFRISCDKTMDYDEYFSKGIRNTFPKEGYTSENTIRLDVPSIEKLLLSLSEIKGELRGQKD